MPIGNVNRQYLVQVPEPYEADKPYALVVGYHGGADAQTALTNLGTFEAAGGNAILVYPEGNGGGGATEWNYTEAGWSVALFDAIIEHITTEYCIDTDAIFAEGFSYGGWLAQALGCFRGDIVRGIATKSVSSIPSGLDGSNCVGQVAAQIQGGTTAAAVTFWRGQNACDEGTTTSGTCNAFAGCDDGYPVWACTASSGVHFGTRTWNFFAGL